MSSSDASCRRGTTSDRWSPTLTRRTSAHVLDHGERSLLPELRVGTIRFDDWLTTDASDLSRHRRLPGRSDDGLRVESQTSTRLTGFHRGGGRLRQAGSRERLDPLVALAPSDRFNSIERGVT